jgi:hypothetical protein
MKKSAAPLQTNCSQGFMKMERLLNSEVLSNALNLRKLNFGGIKMHTGLSVNASPEQLLM